MLEVVTFTGVDEATDLERVADLHARFHGRLEFAVLIGTRSGSADHPIYPPLRFVDRFRQFCGSRGVPAALHMCGRFARSAVDIPVQESLLKIVEGFGRVQLNLIPPQRYGFAGEIARFAEAVPMLILQHEGTSWDNLPVARENIEYLWDRSGGRGVVSFADWPTPPLQDPWIRGDTRPRYGYAGGIGPDNAAAVAAVVGSRMDARVWVDMESRIRTDGQFDLDKVEAVAATLQGIMQPGRVGPEPRPRFVDPAHTARTPQES